MSVISIKSQLVSKLQAMQTLKSVTAFETSNATGSYPLACVSLREGDAEFRSTAHNLRKYGYWVRIYQEQSKIGQGPQNAEVIAANVLDELETALDMDTTLSGTCKYAIPVSWNADYIDREMDTRILEVKIDAYDMVSSL